MAEAESHLLFHKALVMNLGSLFQSHSQAVNEAFVELFDSGLIYRGNFLVNWCQFYKTF
jgi:valyl-tRNA synthetase